MNSTQARSRVLNVARFLSDEAQHHPRGRSRAQLSHAAHQLAYIARSIESQPGPVVESMLDAAIELAVASASARADWAVLHG